MRQESIKTPEILNSWKEIAAYLERSVRTVQRWERDLRMPIHRIGKGKRAPVYASVRELKFWLSTSGIPGQPELRAKVQAITANRKSFIEDSHRLLSNAHALAQSLAENTVRQRRQAEQLQANLLRMRLRMKRG